MLLGRRLPPTQEEASGLESHFLPLHSHLISFSSFSSSQFSAFSSSHLSLHSHSHNFPPSLLLFAQASPTLSCKLIAYNKANFTMALMAASAFSYSGRSNRLKMPPYSLFLHSHHHHPLFLPFTSSLFPEMQLLQQG